VMSEQPQAICTSRVHSSALVLVITLIRSGLPRRAAPQNTTRGGHSWRALTSLPNLAASLATRSTIEAHCSAQQNLHRLPSVRRTRKETNHSSRVNHLDPRGEREEVRLSIVGSNYNSHAGGSGKEARSLISWGTSIARGQPRQQTSPRRPKHPATQWKPQLRPRAPMKKFGLHLPVPLTVNLFFFFCVIFFFF